MTPASSISSTVCAVVGAGEREDLRLRRHPPDPAHGRRAAAGHPHVGERHVGLLGARQLDRRAPRSPRCPTSSILGLAVDERGKGLADGRGVLGDEHPDQPRRSPAPPGAGVP